MIKRIICIDDDQSILDIVKEVLEITGRFQVSFMQANEAADRAAALKPDLILLDMVMLGMDGIATIKALKSRDETKEFPVAFLTSKSKSMDAAQYMALGACGVICKPIDVEDLSYQVEVLCAMQHQRRNYYDELKAKLAKFINWRPGFLKAEGLN